MARRPEWGPSETPFLLHNVAARGVTRHMIHAAQANGSITRLKHGVYVRTAALAQDPVGAHLQLALAHQLSRPELIASHETAAFASGIAQTDSVASAVPPTFILPARGTARSEVGSPKVFVRPLPRVHRVEHSSGLLLTSPARTAVDLAATQDLPDALIVLDSAARLLLTERVGSARLRDHYASERSVAAVRNELCSAAALAFPRRFPRRLTGALAHADPRRESPLESMSFGEMVRFSFPLPELQQRVETRAGVFFPDFMWGERRVIGEADGMGKYKVPEDLARERVREGLLRELGFQVVRWTWAEMRHDPVRVLQRIEAALDQHVL